MGREIEWGGGVSSKLSKTTGSFNYHGQEYTILKGHKRLQLQSKNCPN
jgi:hypothetical protein